MTIYDITQEGFTVENSADLIMGAAAFFPPTTVVSLIYFGGKLIISFIPEDADLSPSGIMNTNDPTIDGGFPSGPLKY